MGLLQGLICKMIANDKEYHSAVEYLLENIGQDDEERFTKTLDELHDFGTRRLNQIKELRRHHEKSENNPRH
jgi:hypothetical protein